MVDDSPTVSDDLIGQVFAEKYQILSKLGQGGMGAVYKAQHRYLQHIVAVKLLRVELLDEDQGIKRFLREGELGKRVDSIDARLAKLETLLAGALDTPSEPDPALVYAVPVDGDPYVGTEHARITLIEGFEFA